MKRGILLLLVLSVFALLFIAGCVQQPTTEPETESEVTTPTTEETTAPSPEPEMAEEEAVETTDEGCVDECENYGCDNFTRYVCVMRVDGCKDKVVSGYVRGLCGVECTGDKFCKTDQQCVEYKCVAKTESTETA